MRPLTSSLLILSCSLALAACSGGDGETNTNQDPDPGSQFPSYCDVQEWECTQFEEGPTLTGSRHGHDAFVLDYERVLLVGGFIRDNDGRDQRVDTCEIVNPITNETRVVTNGQNNDCFIRTRRDPVIVQLQDKSLLAMGGASATGERINRVERFNLETEQWEWTADMPVDYRVRVLNPMLMDDGRVFLLRVDEQFGQFNPNIPGGQIYDPETDTWTAVAMPELEVDTLGGIILPGNRILMVLAEVDAMSKEPLVIEDPDLGELTYHQGHPLRLYLYDIDDQSWERLGTLDVRGVGLRPSLKMLPERGWVLINVYGDDLRPTFGYLFDPDTNFRQQQFEREPVPGRAVAVLPGDRVLYQSNDFAQYYDLDTNQWWQFDAYASGTYFTSLVQLEDCRIFGSGERALPPTEDQTFERAGIDSGYCTPEAAQ